MKYFLFLLLILQSSFTSQAGQGSAPLTPPDFKVQVGEDQNAKMRGWLLLFTPPEHFHFNIQAPMKVTAQEISFIRVGATEAQVGYRSSDFNLKEGQTLSAEIFLCDDQKTVCVKKTLAFPLKKNSDLHELNFLNPNPQANSAQEPKVKKVKKKDEFGFWDNDLDSALAEARTRHLPLLIDFYGIWCPPCNLLNETVFSKPEFRKTAKNWILLKMDADRPESFELKSHFKVGGYPTMIAVKELAVKEPGAVDPISRLEEINRVVGYYSVSEMNAKFAGFFSNRKLSLEQKLTELKEAYSETLIQLTEIKKEKKETIEALNLAEEGARTFPNEHYYQIVELKLKLETAPAVLKEAASHLLVKSVAENRQRERSETLLETVDLLTTHGITHSDPFSLAELALGDLILDALSERLDSKTLSVPGVELSIADLDGLRVDLAESQNDEGKALKARLSAIQSNQKLMKFHHDVESRGLNLELAYLYSQTGQRDAAERIYTHFIEKFPHEFTFYFAASRLYLDAKDYPHARQNAEDAFKYAYGDNQVRAMERLLKIQIAQGEKTQASARGKQYLGENPEKKIDFSVRTQRYRQALQKTIDEAGKI